LNKDTLVTVLSDMHSGGSTALFPNRFWQSTTTEHNHTPTHKQASMYRHFENCMEYAAQNRKGKRLIVVHDGDAIEGVHHNSIQVITQNKSEQAGLHIDLMDTFLQRARFSKKNGDLLYYVSGTETHTGDVEQSIAKDLSAEKNPEGGRIFDHLELNINGRILWFVHHGKGRGKGANEGNELRNWLRDVFWDCMKVKKQPPDVVVTGHTHTPTWNTYVARNVNDFHMIHGVICPSWQMKTRYGYKVAPVERNEIGAAFVEIKADGEIRTPSILMMEIKDRRAIMV
jgi:predicted phosphodiesterase